MIKLHNIFKTYKTGKVEFQALKGIDLTIDKGEFVAIMGPSGSGKSTLMHVIGFLDTPDSGKYFFNETDISRFSEDELAEIRNKTVGFVFQQFHLLPRENVFENVNLPWIYSGKIKDERIVFEKVKINGPAGPCQM